MILAIDNLGLLELQRASASPLIDQQLVEEFVDHSSELAEYLVPRLAHDVQLISLISRLHASPEVLPLIASPRLPVTLRGRIVRFVPNISKILAATDFSEDSTLALTYAEDFARKFGAEMVILHVDQPLAPVMASPDLGPAMDVGAMSRIAEEQRLIAQRELDKIVQRLRDSGLKAKSLLKVGSPFLEILHAAQTENADLVVLGTHGRSGLAHVLMGSVAERVVQKCHAPVLTVRHPDRKFKHPLDK